MGFRFEGLVDKVGHKIDKKGSSANLKHKGSYGRISSSHVSSEKASQYSEHSQDKNNSGSLTGVGHLPVGEKPRSANPHPNYQDSDQLNKEISMLRENEDLRRRQYFEDPAFTGGGLLGKMMNASERGARGTPGKVGSGSRYERPYARQGRGRSSSEDEQELPRPPGRYRHKNGPPRHEALRLVEGLHSDHAREYHPGASHDHWRRENERHGVRGFGGDKEQMQNPFDDRERY